MTNLSFALLLSFPLLDSDESEDTFQDFDDLRDCVKSKLPDHPFPSHCSAPFRFILAMQRLL